MIARTAIPPTTPPAIAGTLLGASCGPLLGDPVAEAVGCDALGAGVSVVCPKVLDVVAAGKKISFRQSQYMNEDLRWPEGFVL